MASSGLQGPLHIQDICELMQAYAHKREDKYFILFINVKRGKQKMRE